MCFSSSPAPTLTEYRPSQPSSYDSERERSDVHKYSVFNRTEERGAPFSRPRSAAKALCRRAFKLSLLVSISAENPAGPVKNGSKLPT